MSHRVWKIKARIALALMCGITQWNPTAVAAPLNGQLRTFEQPDGTKVPVRVFGDEFYARLEGEDGYTLVRDPSNGYLCYAELSAKGDAFVSTGRTYRTAQPDPGFLGRISSFLSEPAALPPLPEPGIALPSDAVSRQVDAARRTLGGSAGAVRRAGAPSPAPTATMNVAPSIAAAPAAPPVEHIRGLTLLVRFPNEPITYTREDIEKFVNQPSYNGFGNQGSVRDYFLDASGGRMDYSNVVVEYYESSHDRAYYLDPTQPFGSRASDLVTEAIHHLDGMGFDFSTLTTTAEGEVRGLNAFYAGDLANEPASGLWPHQSKLLQKVVADGVTLSRYQISNMDSSGISLGTFCHESGHLLFDWPDLYDTSGYSQGIGEYGLMGHMNDRDPVAPEAPLRDMAKWETVTDVTHVPPGTEFVHEANSLTSFLFTNSRNPNEMFYIESRARTGRNRTFPEEGWVIWHVDWAGSNDYWSMCPNQHYLVSLVQSDGRFDLERNEASVTGDVYRFPDTDRFDGTTIPNSNWWFGFQSGLAVRFTSPLGSRMTVRFGDP